MTTIERLIKNACEARRGVVLQEKDSAKSALVSEVPLEILPVRLQDSVREYARLAKRLNELSAIIDKAGYDPPRDSCQCDGAAPKHIKVDYQRRNDAEKVISTRANVRLSAIDKLRHETHIACLGKTTQHSKTLLEKLQRDLAKV